jgi:hypothetical protein
MNELSRLLARDPDPKAFLSRAYMTGHLQAAHYRVPRANRVTREKRLYDAYDFGYGTITNVGVMSLSNDALWPSPSAAAMNTLALSIYMATGTGATGAASTDVTLQTADAMTPATGVATLVSAANSQAEKVIGTINYTGTEAVTEWGLFNSPTLTASTGTPWTAGSATTGTATGTPYTASTTSVRGETQFVFADTTKSPHIYGLCVSNTTSVITVPAWYKVTDGTAAGTFPSSTDVLAIYPVMLDHMVFSAINVANSDSITFTFTLSFPSGG